MKVSKLVKYSDVEFECIEAHLYHIGFDNSIEKEWVGTKLIWKIEQQSNNTKISFTHLGLKPELKCYDICESGWDYYFVGELKKYLEE